MVEAHDGAGDGSVARAEDGARDEAEVHREWRAPAHNRRRGAIRRDDRKGNGNSAWNFHTSQTTAGMGASRNESLTQAPKWCSESDGRQQRLGFLERVAAPVRLELVLEPSVREPPGLLGRHRCAAREVA